MVLAVRLSMTTHWPDPRFGGQRTIGTLIENLLRARPGALALLLVQDLLTGLMQQQSLFLCLYLTSPYMASRTVRAPHNDLEGWRI